MRYSMLALTVAAMVASAPAVARDVTVANTSKWNIHRIYVSPCGNRYWGANRVSETDILAIGKSAVLAVEGSCSDLKIVDEDGDVCVTPLHEEVELALTTKFLIACQNQR